VDSWHTSGVRIDRPAVALADAGDAALASAAALGDRAAFEVVVHRYGPMLYRYARRMLTNEHDVADAVQETFVAAWRQLGTFRASSSLKTWLFSICARKIVDTYRVKSAQPIDDLALHTHPATGPDPFASASASAFLAALELALDELPPRQRASWVLKEVEEMTFPQIGDILGLSPDTARGHHFRATRTLRERLRRWK
jgi:RNA polymerase sigma-70 factor (ECF subfamily)